MGPVHGGIQPHVPVALNFGAKMLSRFFPAKLCVEAFTASEINVQGASRGIRPRPQWSYRQHQMPTQPHECQR